jgi:hypothetical protein
MHARSELDVQTSVLAQVAEHTATEGPEMPAGVDGVRQQYVAPQSSLPVH